MRAKTLIVTMLLAVHASAARADTIYAAVDGAIEQFTTSGIGSIFASDPTLYGIVERMTFDRAGNLYMATGMNTIERITPSGVGSVFASTVWPTGLAFDKAGNLYVGSYNTGEIRKFSPNGVDLGVFAATGYRVRDIAMDSNDNLYCVYADKATPARTTISKITPSGDILVFAGNLTNTGPYRSVELDTTGTLYAQTADADGTYLIQKFSPTGTDLGAFATGLGGGADMALDSDGNLYVVDEHSGVIERFSATGVDLGVFVSGLTRPMSIAIQVPEPATLLLLTMGWLVMIRHRRR